MTYRSADLTAELRDLVDAEPPPCALDLDAARARGLIFRRRRRATRVGGSVAGTCLAVLLVFAFVVHGAAPGAEPDGSASGSAAPVPSPATVHDPLSPLVYFGWLPTGVHLTGSTGTYTTASDGSTEFGVMALAPGKPVSHQCSDSSPVAATALVHGEPPQCNVIAPDVNGHPAYWAFPPGSADAFVGFVELVWQYAPNAWALLDANIGKDVSNDIVPTVYKVAESLQFKANSLPLPFHLPSAPAGLVTMTVRWQGAPSAARGSQPGNKWIGVDLSYSSPPSGTEPASIFDLTTDVPAAKFPTAAQLRISANPTPAKDIKYLTIDGLQAVTVIGALDGGEPIERLVVHDVDGVDFALSASGTKAIAAVNAAGGLVGYYHAMQVLGADPANWTTDVIG